MSVTKGTYAHDLSKNYPVLAVLVRKGVKRSLLLHIGDFCWHTERLKVESVTKGNLLGSLSSMGRKIYHSESWCFRVSFFLDLRTWWEKVWTKDLMELDISIAFVPSDLHGLALLLIFISLFAKKEKHHRLSVCWACWQQLFKSQNNPWKKHWNINNCI